MVLRKDIDYAMGSSFGNRDLSNEQFKKIQKNGVVKLSIDLRKQLNDALLWYSLDQDTNINSSRKEDQEINFRKAMECVTFLQLFLDNEEDHSVYMPRMRIEDELFSLMNKNIEEDWETINDFADACISTLQLKTQIAESKEKEIGTIIDFKQMRKNLLFLEVVMKRAFRKFENEVAQIEDKGGKDEDWPLNSLLLKLHRIYEAGLGKKGGFERFCIAVVETIPEDLRPIMPNAPGSISKRVARLLDDSKKNLTY